MHIYSPADATVPIPRYLLPHLNPDWFHLSGTGLPTLSWKRGCSTGVVVVVMFISNSYTHTTVVSSGTSCLNLFQPIRILASTAASASPCLFQIHTHTQPLNGLLSRTTRRNIHLLTPIVIIGHPLSSSSIYNNPWHPLC